MKYVVTLNNKNYEVEVTETEAVITSVSETAAPAAPAAAPAAPAAVLAPAAAEGIRILSPMPGTILSVKVTMGQAVKAGDVLFVLEAMKMENDIVASEDGTVKQLLVQKGSTVDTDQLLATI